MAENNPNEITGYGPLSSREELEKAIEERKNQGKNLTGEATIYLGGNIIKEEDGSINLNTTDGKVVVQQVRVGPTGNYRIYMDTDPSTDHLPPPSGWKEEENP